MSDQDKEQIEGGTIYEMMWSSERHHFALWQTEGGDAFKLTDAEGEVVIQYPPKAMIEHDNIPTPRTDKRDGNWLDSFGCCKVCDGEIPHGHTPNCDIYKLEQKVTTAERELATVTKDYEQFCQLSKYCVEGLEMRRDSLISEVESLKTLLRDCDNTFANGAHAKNPIRDNIWKAIGPAPAQSEPSHPSGKDHPLAWETLCKQLSEELAAAQATIAEQETRYYNLISAMGTDQKNWVWALHELRAENAALRAERDAITRISNDKYRRVEDLESQLATAIAERDAALVPICIGQPLIQILAKEGQWVSEDGRGLVAADGLFRKDPYAQRDCALAACAAKDDALREVMDHLSRHDSGVNYWREKEVSVIRPFPNNIHAYHEMREALSPTAGNNYVQKAPMVELLEAGLWLLQSLTGFMKQKGFKQETIDNCADVVAFNKALAAAAPFLTDSTGEEADARYSQLPRLARRLRGV